MFQLRNLLKSSEITRIGGMAEMPLRLSDEQIDWLAADPTVRIVQFRDSPSDSTWSRLNERFFLDRPDVALRVYAHHGKVCNLRFCARMTHVRHFIANCLQQASGVEYLAAMAQLKSLNVGIFDLESFDFLKQVPAGITGLYLSATRSKKLDISVVSRFTELKTLYLEGQQKGIQSIASLQNLEKLTLRSITLKSLELLRQLQKLWSLEIKLGGTKNLSALEGMTGLKYLELWRILGLANLDVLSTLSGLQFLSLQTLKNIQSLPPLENLSNLRRINLDDLSGLTNIESLLLAPALEEVLHVENRTISIETYEKILAHPTLKQIHVGFCSGNANARFQEILKARGFTPFQRTEFQFV
jgi:hypothetical protein